MTRRDYLLIVCLALALPSAALSAAPAPVGYWLVQEGTSVVRIEESGGKLGGRIVWLKEPNYPAGDARGRTGQPKVDERNPDSAQRERKLLGLPIVWGFAPPDAKGVCEGGQVYDPRNGKTYSGTITMAGKDRLELRGYIMVSLIGRTSTWARVDPGKYGLKP
ncbi:DUF2147 domain-containing protein [Candidatus Thiodictyon syntrophicum]|jgi:uncharacterized protein (DUF2147 family)|uniref:DUF2147 domain-containing protein n=1 Tax=Candidatus Thiodictyon syntrophicum TaxID=1166950 RepID=A0A2K8U648_9GAMM|nr:DUF2147 domain-containing protein [Candidatus Thiodictyon syntrophicum]AUB81044.1 hypothetical protein THSYN_08830 [Candidatus Thiodictyon syntrophicum]